MYARLGLYLNFENMLPQIIEQNFVDLEIR